VLSTGIQGTTVVGAFAPLGTPDWAVFVELPWDEAYQEVIRNGIASGVILVVMAALAGLLGVYVARRLSVPLVSLTDTASKISAGELELQANVSGPGEVAQLATSFNSMTAQLRNLIGELEDRVQARTGQLRASAEVGRAVTSILDPDQLLKQVADLITERFGFYYTAVFVLDEDGRYAILRAATGEAGRILLERGHRLPVDEQSMVGGAIVTRSARIALDVGQGAVRFANPLLPNTRSEIALSLRVGERILGALDVQSEQAGAFDEASAEVLQTMADQIAVALFNAESFRRAERQTTTMALLNQLSRNLTTSTSLEDIALAVLPAAKGLFGQPRLAIVQKTANPQILSLREFSSDPDRPVGDSQAIQAADSLIGECIQRGEVIYIPDLSQLMDKYSDVTWFYGLGLRSDVILPLRVGERVLGTLNVGADQIEAYSADQINQLEQITAQVAITVENLNLAEQTQQTLAELDTANRQLIGQAWGQYVRTTQLEAAEWRNGAWNVLTDRATQRETSQALVSTTAPLSLPIKVRGTTIGEFNITAADARQIWNNEDMIFAQSLIDQVGQVLETARLLDETERTAQREKAVADAADKIHRSTDIESVLQSAVAELQRITGRHGISVQLGFGRAQQTGGRTSSSGAAMAAGNGQAAESEGGPSNA
jgi:GAF domain-containing protein/HAMP domain-containing protein